MKMKHNKKRNTAFVYEALIRELTRAAIEGKSKRKAALASLIKESFASGTTLARELECYSTLAESSTLDRETAQRLIVEVRRVHGEIDKDTLFAEQSNLINKINKGFGSYVFSNNVPNYRSLATIASVLNQQSSIKSRVLMEQVIIEDLTSTELAKQETAESVDDFTVKTFANNFNSRYGSLLDEQREFLSHYITADADGGTALKVFLNEELSRIKSAVEKSLVMTEVKEDEEMTQATNNVLALINEYATRELDESDLKKIMKLQKLASEYQADAN